MVSAKEVSAKVSMERDPRLRFLSIPSVRLRMLLIISCGYVTGFYFILIFNVHFFGVVFSLGGFLL